MWPFRRKPFLDDSTARWHLNNFSWLIRNHSLRSQFATSRLVVPDGECIVAGNERGHKLALMLFNQVKAYCGFAESAIPLREGARQPGPHSATAGDGGERILGTYNSGGRHSAPHITYMPNLLNDAEALIATLAHELGHHLLHEDSQEHMLVRRGEEEERLTDLTAIFMGFGVFLSNCAFNIKTKQNTVTYSYQGYLPERELIFATAIYITVKRLDPKSAFRYLKPPRRRLLKQALRDLEAHCDAIATMRLLIPTVPKQRAEHLRVVR